MIALVTLINKSNHTSSLIVLNSALKSNHTSSFFTLTSSLIVPLASELKSVSEHQPHKQEIDRYGDGVDRYGDEPFRHSDPYPKVEQRDVN